MADGGPIELLPSAPLLVAFLAASFVLAVTPGPGVVFIVTRTLAQGRQSGLASVAGVALGNLGNAVGAAIGLGAILAVSSAAFLAVKYAGAAYLVYLGVQMLRKTPEARGAVAREAAGTRRVFRDGFVVALLNPKTAVFFAAFLPQFMSVQVWSGAQSLVLGALFVAIAAVTDSLYALSASAIAPLLARAQATQQVGRYLAGGIYVGLGVFTALGGSRSAE